MKILSAWSHSFALLRAEWRQLLAAAFAPVRGLLIGYLCLSVVSLGVVASYPQLQLTVFTIANMVVSLLLSVLVLRRFDREKRSVGRYIWGIIRATIAAFIASGIAAIVFGLIALVLAPLIMAIIYCISWVYKLFLPNLGVLSNVHLVWSLPFIFSFLLPLFFCCSWFDFLYPVMIYNNYSYKDGIKRGFLLGISHMPFILFAKLLHALFVLPSLYIGFVYRESLLLLVTMNSYFFSNIWVIFGYALLIQIYYRLTTGSYKN